MDWLDALGLGASAVSGGLFGVIGAGISAWFKNKQKQDDRAHEKEMIKLRMEVASQGGSWDGLTSSQINDAELNKQSNYKWVIAVKSLFRPFLTIFLWVAVYVEMVNVLDGTLTTYLTLAEAKEALFTKTELITILRYIIYSTVFSATTATTWWFGERALSIPEMKNR